MTTSYISRTGRVQSWIDDPRGRLPVSCTVFNVDDSMEGPMESKPAGALYLTPSETARELQSTCQNCDPEGHDNGKGLVASGPVSFGKIYSSLNEVLRRGGKYKNGAIVLHYDLDGADIIEFITASRAELPWVKRCVNITEDCWEAASEETKSALLFGIKSGDIWLNKIKHDNEGRPNPWKRLS